MAINMDFRSFERVSGTSAGRLLLLCDHASNALPPEYGSLGLPADDMARHIAYDIGVRNVAMGLVTRLGGRALLSCFSRLLIDPNRGLDDPTLIMRLSDGAMIPGNRNIDEAERSRRIARFYQPYHAAIAAEIDAMLGRGVVPLIVSLHSFTPAWKSVPRPWHVGILWDADRATAQALMRGFADQDGLLVGDNEPYHGALEGDTIDTHAARRGLPHGLIELRQDLIATKSGVDEWVERVARVLEPILNDHRLSRTQSREH
jgi:predicted N-formylglutamate amidohydrolase